MSRFVSPEAVAERLLAVSYLATPMAADAVFLADQLAKPLLVEGPAGVGKTELAKSVAAVTDARLIRLQCYEGLDEGKALYEWDYRRQLLALQSGPSGGEAAASLFSEDYLLERPLLAAIRARDPVVLLVDEVDRLEVETEALLLEVLSDFQVSIPEIGTVTARRRPLVFLTSNATRELSEALKRRCLFLHVDYPAPAREAEIVQMRVPETGAALAAHVARVAATLRGLELRKPPSLSETIDWARVLLLLDVAEVDVPVLRRTLPVLLKNADDVEVASRELGLTEPK